MKRLLLALIFCCFAAGARAENTIGPSNLIICNKIATLAVGPSSITQIIAGVAGQAIHICGWDASNTGATGTFSFQYGTGVNCASGTTTLIPALNITSTAPAVDRQQYATMDIPIANAVCVTPSVATIAVVLWYSQF